MLHELGAMPLQTLTLYLTTWWHHCCVVQRCGDPTQFAENWEAICRHGPYATKTMSTLSDTTEGSLLQVHEIEQRMLEDVTQRFSESGKLHTGNCAKQTVSCS
jgi:hypothetical protein